MLLLIVITEKKIIYSYFPQFVSPQIVSFAKFFGNAHLGDLIKISTDCQFLRKNDQKFTDNLWKITVL